MKRTERRFEAAHEVADWLDQQGQPFRATAVRDVCRSLATATGTLAQLHRDNQELRDELRASARETA